jgi:hypothetical protein
MEGIMLSIKEKEIIEKCFSISVWSHRAGKAEMKGNRIEVEVFEERIKSGIVILERLIMDLHCPTAPPLTIADIKKNRRISRFFSRIVGRGLK